MPPRRSSYVRKGIERNLLRREQGLKALRDYFTEHVCENLDTVDFLKQRHSLVLALDLHLKLVEKIRADVATYEPRYFNGALQKFMPLTQKVLDARREARDIKRKSHVDEATKNKSRRLKSS